MWSLAVNRALASGGVFGEIHWACRQLHEAARAGTHGDQEAWHLAWTALARQVEGTAREAARSEHQVTARQHFLRASLYYQWAEAFLSPDDARCKPLYRSHLDTFAEAARRSTPAIEIVEIPFDGATLHAYFVAAPGSGPRPAVLLSDGLDGTKEEMIYVALALAERGVSTLAIDHPG